MFRNSLRHIDWVLLSAVIPIIGAGLVTMMDFTGRNAYFNRQILWVSVAACIALFFAQIDFRFLRKTIWVTLLYFLGVGGLLFVLLFGAVFKGAQGWFDLGAFAVQPADPMKLILILLLAKYFSRRHIEIANFKHIIISGIYAAIPFFLMLLQPDFGSAIIVFAIWFGMVLVSGISKKHLFLVLGGGILAFLVLWFFVFEPYQKARIITFIDPMEDIRGAGYNAYQSAIAVGSGGLLGKGIGYGTQSRLQFLPEHQTDFIFAAFAEEWGFVGVVLLLLCYGVIVWRIIAAALLGASNFETLFAVGLAVFFMVQFIVHVGMNMGLLPVTGQTLPFMSYGGSHLVTEFAGLGILFAMRRYSRDVHRESMTEHFHGI